MDVESATSLGTVCTCKACDHDFAKDCLEAGCTCCIKGTHSMVMDGMESSAPHGKLVRIPAGPVVLEGDLYLPSGSRRGLVLFAHGSGSSRHSPRNRYVASVLQQADLGTLLFDLLTRDEERIDDRTARLRFDIGLLAGRLVAATDWVMSQASDVRIGYFGASTGAAAALVAAAKKQDAVSAIVSRGGRPDLAGRHLNQVRAPTLLIVGGDDEPVITLNRQALNKLLEAKDKRLEIVPGATHLFEEPGKLEQAASLARGWFEKHLAAAATTT